MVVEDCAFASALLFFTLLVALLLDDDEDDDDDDGNDFFPERTLSGRGGCSTSARPATATSRSKAWSLLKSDILTILIYRKGLF